MDLIIILILLAGIVFLFRRFDSIIYFLASFDILLRIIGFLKNNITSSELATALNNYIPASLPSIINKYTSGIFNEILIWLYVVIFIIFEYYIIKTLIKKK